MEAGAAVMSKPIARCVDGRGKAEIAAINGAFVHF